MTSSGNEDSTTKERLLEVALEILAKEGIGGLTIRRIAERASVSVSVVHHHYINKQGLIDACKGSFYRGVGVVVSEVLAKGAQAPLEGAIDMAVRAIWAYARKNVPLLRVLASEAFAEGQIIEKYRGYDERPFLAAATAVLAPRLGLSIKATRARVQSMGVLVTRFAVSSDDELVSLFGEDTDPRKDAEDELVEIAKLVLLGRLPAAS